MVGRNRQCAVQLCVVLIICALLPAAARAADQRGSIHALVVGINDYEHLPALEGAVADAEDIASVLRRADARMLTVLRNRQATRAAIERAWNRLVAAARSGDTIVFTYAGHGGQEPEKVPGSEPDGKDEAFLLSGFNPKPGSPGLRERIVDNRINLWFREAGKRGLRVVFVADACHSGSMMRAPDTRMPQSVRAGLPYGLPESLLTSADLRQGAELSEEQLPHVTFLAATQDNRKAPEVVIGGHRRGALSWAFARALERGADYDGDGVITRSELVRYIGVVVRQASEAQQTAEIRPRSGDGDAAIFAGLPKPAGAGAGLEDVVLGLRLTNLPAGEAPRRAAKLKGARLVEPDAAADLVWDAKAGEVVNATGDIVAHDVRESELQGVIDKWRVLPALKAMVVAKPLAMTLSPDDSRHPAGRAVTFESEPIRYPHVTAVNLAPDGSLLFLYPRSDDPPVWRKGQAYSLDLKVIPPVGGDHLLVIASEKPLTGFADRLRLARTHELPALLRIALERMDYQIGLQGLYTVEEPGL